MRSIRSLVIASVISATSSMATTYTINPEGTGDFPTIQAGIDAALDGDVIELTDGTFTGDGNRDIGYLGKAITVRSQSGDPTSCVIDCEGGGAGEYRGFIFTADDGPGAVLEGIGVTNGYATWGGGIHCGGSPLITGCRFFNNCSPGSEGGGVCVDGGAPTIEECVFHHNSAYNGGGISTCFTFMATPQTIRCTFIENTATNEGGGARY